MEEHPVHGPVYKVKSLDGGREAVVVPITSGRARLCAGSKDSPVYDDMW